VKTDYAGDPDAMRGVVQDCPIPILVLGGSRYSSDAEALALIHAVAAAGAAGVFFGRNVFQADDMLAFLQNARAALNENETSPARR
jgi:DhnA family fructose-bisphosphate aldolase class Ia